MGRVAKAFDALRIRSLSPDRRIQGELRNRKVVSVDFVSEDDYYLYSSENELSRQLTAVVRSLFVARDEGFRAVIHELTDLSVDVGPHWDAQVRRFREERDSTEFEGLSTGEWVKITVVGMRDAAACVTKGALDNLSADEFLDEFQSAISDFWSDYSEVMVMLRESYQISLSY